MLHHGMRQKKIRCMNVVPRSNIIMVINQKVIVLSVTAKRHIDTVMLLFDDCTTAKQTELNAYVSLVENSRKNSKLLQLLAPVSSPQSKREKLSGSLTDHSSLTLREKEVMQLVSEGFSSKEIAGKLFINRHTVESDRKHILRKLSVKNATNGAIRNVLI
jgi:DNA-binding CsgD family transcriptional regulator